MDANLPSAMIPELLAGFVFGITGDADLTEIQSCFTGAETLLDDVEKLGKDLKSFKLLRAFMDSQRILLNVQAALQPCTSMSDDIATIETMIAQLEALKDMEELGYRMSYNFLTQMPLVKSSVGELEAHVVAKEWFETGETAADLSTSLLKQVVTTFEEPQPVVLAAEHSIAEENGIDIHAVNHIIAGLIYGMTTKSDLEEVEACYTGGTEMEQEIKAAVKDFKTGGWDNITQGVLEVLLAAFQIPQELHTCRNMDEDVAAIAAWFAVFGDRTALISKVTKHVLLHKKKIQEDVAVVEADLTAEEYFHAGNDMATILIDVLGPFEPHYPDETPADVEPASEEDVTGLDVSAINHIIAGLIYGLTSNNDLEEIEACYAGGSEIDGEIEAAIADFTAGGWDNITQGSLEVALVLLQLPQVFNECTGMDEDLAAIADWLGQVTSKADLTKAVSKALLFHRKEIKADVAAIQDDYATEKYFETGEDMADLMV